MHTDEAINAYIIGDLLAGKAYQYDPKDRHGPALYAVALPIAKLAGVKNFAGMTETSVRLGPALVGAFTVLLFGLLLEALGTFPTLGAALLFAISPITIYYSCDFIHETLFVAATLWTIAFAFRILQENSTNNAVALGACAGLMLACKETATLHFAAFGIAALFWLGPARLAYPRSIDWRPVARAGAIAFISFCVILVTLYTWGGTRWQGLADLGHSIPHLASRASGEGHQKPAWYYLALLTGGWSGIPVLLLAACGAVTLPWKNSSGKIFPALVVYLVVIALLYSVIPYKTPWLALNLWLPIALLAGNGFAWFWQTAGNNPGRIGFAVIALALIAALGRDTVQRVFIAPAGERNPYAYAQTVEDILRLPERVQQLAEKSPAGNNLRIAVVATDPWPMPWYLRKFPHVGFWQPYQDTGAADVYITSAEAAGTAGAPWEKWRPEFFGVRPEVLMLLWTPPETASPHE
jgi:uncharacterized protein (TIGR03663 family)